MWFVGKPVLDLCGHLGKEPEKSAEKELIVSVCLEMNDAQLSRIVWNINKYKTMSKTGGKHTMRVQVYMQK